MADALLSFEVSRKDTERFAEVMQRAQDELGVTPKNAITWAGYFVSKSLGAASKKAPKLRKIVVNPDAKGKGAKKRMRDPSFVKYGVFTYDGNGEKTFVPISEPQYKGLITFASRTTGQMLIKDMATGEVHRLQGSSKAEQVTPGISRDKRRIIKRSGLLKDSWKWAGKMTRKGGSASIMGAQDSVNVKWTGQRFAPTLTLANNLRYAADGLKHGDNGVEHVMEKAANSMANRINDRLEKALQS